MKRPTCFRFQKAFSFGLSVAALTAVFSTQAQIVTLTDNNSVADINTSSQAGMFNWNVDGQNQLRQQWFWYRVGNTFEQSIDTISAPVNVLAGLNGVSSTYANAAYSVRVQYTLGGGLPGSGSSDIAEIITINNLSGAPLDFHLFQYSDFNLNGPGNDVVQLGGLFLGKLYAAGQQDVGTLSENMDNVSGANLGEVAFFNATLVKLNDAAPDNLNNVLGPIGPGDVTWAFQWDFLIQPGGSAQISKDKQLHLTQVPEPSTLALVSVGLVACACCTRRGRRN